MVWVRRQALISRLPIRPILWRRSRDRGPDRMAYTTKKLGKQDRYGGEKCGINVFWLVQLLQPAFTVL